MDERLISMLKGAKDVMNKVDSNDNVKNSSVSNVSSMSDKAVPTYNGVDGTKLLESLPDGVNPNMVNEYSARPSSTEPIQQTYKNLHTSKMPPEVLKAMIDKPITPVAPKINAAGLKTFDLSDVPTELLKTNQSVATNVVENIQTPTNQYGQKVITLTEAELDAKIKNALFEFMSTTFTKTLTEATIKKTIGTLIKEGKIKVNQKKKPIK